ncbi:hypothetical protein [Anabaena sp. UHCC 0451]|uniref:hypothetical protein n=1 Tax=Anabaena sp. UHCC 0451 TaxID=2055235 RepID=UPI002B1F56A7|nr:hypothetical protein [Anabaena sp. UHCC 0451]MEA5576611.1 hypothetical protein [Anabaena sp. UHCC 0451]
MSDRYLPDFPSSDRTTLYDPVGVKHSYKKNRQQTDNLYWRMLHPVPQVQHKRAKHWQFAIIEINKDFPANALPLQMAQLKWY